MARSVKFYFFCREQGLPGGKGEDIHVARADRLGKHQGPGGDLLSPIRQGYGEGAGRSAARRRRPSIGPGQACGRAAGSRL